MQRNQAVQERARRLLAVLGVCAAVSAFPAALAEPAATAATWTYSDRAASALGHCRSEACVQPCDGYVVVIDDGDEVEYVRAPGGVCQDPDAHPDPASQNDPASTVADPPVLAAPTSQPSAAASGPGDASDPAAEATDKQPTPHSGILFPEPSKGPPRQFPLHSPTPTPTPKPTHPVVPPSKPAPRAPAPSVVRAAPAPLPVVVAAKPAPAPKPKPKPTPTPPPAAVVHTTVYTVPHHRLSTVLVVFVVAIVPVSLARARR